MEWAEQLGLYQLSIPTDDGSSGRFEEDLQVLYYACKVVPCPSPSESRLTLGLTCHPWNAEEVTLPGSWG